MTAEWSPIARRVARAWAWAATKGTLPAVLIVRDEEQRQAALRLLKGHDDGRLVAVAIDRDILGARKDRR